MILRIHVFIHHEISSCSCCHKLSENNIKNVTQPWILIIICRIFKHSQTTSSTRIIFLITWSVWLLYCWYNRQQNLVQVFAPGDVGYVITSFSPNTYQEVALLYTRVGLSNYYRDGNCNEDWNPTHDTLFYSIPPFLPYNYIFTVIS